MILPCNDLIVGDCLDVLKNIPDNYVDLVYLDPPFFTNKNYEIIWGDGYERKHFKDKWYDSDNQHRGIHSYLTWLEDRLIEIKRVLKLNGSLYLHCDWHANHHIRLSLDDIFGAKNFRNEIVYRSTNSPKSQSATYGTQHETIYYYTKTSKFTFNEVKIKQFKEDYLKSFRYDDNDGKGKYQTTSIIAGGVQKYADRKEFDFKGFKRMWLYSYENLEVMYNNGLLHKTKSGFRKKLYLKDAKGIALSDFWCDIKPKQKTDYPTEKPTSVLERIISVSSNPGDIVLDPMCGGGTTIISAEKLDRKWIGIDISPTACRSTLDRLNDARKGTIKKIIKLTDIKNYSIDDKYLKTRIDHREFENYVRRKLKAKKPIPDEGIDAITQDGVNFLPEGVRRVGVQIKHFENVGVKYVRNLEGDIRNSNKNMNKKYGILVGLSFTRGAKDKTDEFRRKGIIDIQLIEAKDLIQYEGDVGLENWWKGW